jgi:hypothetical protein
MKTTLLLVLISFCTNIRAQTLSIEETQIQVKKADALYKEGKNLLVEFVLLQDTARHAHAMRNFKEANLMVNGTVKQDDWGTTTASLVDSKLMIIKSYSSLYADSFRDRIMAETPAERTKKIKYNGVEYKLSKNSKVNFENLNL